MITETQSRSGKCVLKAGDRHLASAVDPEMEAAKWLEKNSTLIERNPVVIVIGVGSGYHLAQLAERFPEKKIIAIDSIDETRNFFNKQFPLASGRVEVVIQASPNRVFSLSVIKSAVLQRYSVVSFSSACAHDKTGFAELKLSLLGRSVCGAKEILSGRKVVVVRQMHSAQELLSLFDLMNSDVRQELSHKDKCIMNILEELVA